MFTLTAVANFFYVLAYFIVPFLLGWAIARAFRVKDLAWKIGGILFVIGIALAPFLNAAVKGIPMGNVIKKGIDLGGGTNLVYQVVQIPSEPLTNEVMGRVVAAVTKRINPAGTKEIIVRQVGQDRVEVIIPGEDASAVDDIKHRMTTLGSLEFAILANKRDTRNFDFNSALRDKRKTVVVDGELVAVWREIAPKINADGKEEPGQFGFDPRDEIAVRPVEGKPEGYLEVLVINEPNENRRITGKLLKRAYPTTDQSGGPAVGFTFNAEGGQLFSDLTTANKPLKDGFKRRLAILLDNKVVTAPSLRSAIGESGIIEGNFSQKEVEDTVAILNAGSLPREIKKDPISEFTISPTLGTDVQTKGMRALIVTTIAVVAFMAVYYMTAGLIADFAMLLNLLLIVAAMVYIDAAFTLPGLAGLVLSAGMAVDSNVLIYERIREETARGASLRMAIHNGFEKAFVAIFDSHVTTLITSVILYMIGSETVKGFAVSLFIGVAMNLYTAVYVSRIILTVLERSKTITKLKMMSAIGATNFDFVGRQFIACVFSAIVIGTGFIALFARGQNNWDIDFMGGTMLVMQFDKPHKTDEVREKLEKGLDKNITLEELKLASDAPVAAGEGIRYRLRTTDQDQLEVQKRVNETFPNELVKVAMTIGKREAIPAIKTPEKKDGAEAPLPDDEAAQFAGGNKVELTFNREISPSTVQRYVQDALKAIDRQYDVAVTAENAMKIEGLHGSGTEADTSARAGRARLYDKLLILTKPSIPAAALDKAVAETQKTLEASPVFEEVTTFESAVASDTRNSAWLAIILSLVAIIAYLWFRFENLMFGMSAAIAVAHDVAVAVGAVALASYLNETPVGPALMLMDFKINMPMIAAFLTIVGYSLNDTIVIFDRLREVRGKNPHITKEMINDTVNQTLSRTILTALTVFISVLILYLLGGEGIHGFAFCMVIGCVAGTYSTVYIASPLVLWFVERGKKKEAQAQMTAAQKAAASA